MCYRALQRKLEPLFEALTCLRFGCLIPFLGAGGRAIIVVGRQASRSLCGFLACFTKFPRSPADNKKDTDKTSMEGSRMYTSPSARSSAAAYRQVDLNSQVLSASPHGLIGLLYAELRSCLISAKGAMERGDVPGKVRLIGKSMRLLDEGLLAGLDMQAGGELAANLHRIYSYCLLRLTQANARSDVAIVDEVLSVLQPVMDGWREIGSQVHA